MTPDQAPNDWTADAWTQGIESWWKAMGASRQWLEQLGEQVQANLQPGARPVDLADLQQVVQALQLVEERLAAGEAERRATHERLDRLEAQVGGLHEQLGLVARTLSALGGHVEQLVVAQSPAPRPVKKPAARKPAAKKSAAKKPAGA